MEGRGDEAWGISSLVTRGEITVTQSRWTRREGIFQGRKSLSRGRMGGRSGV